LKQRWDGEKSPSFLFPGRGDGVLSFFEEKRKNQRKKPFCNKLRSLWEKNSSVKRQSGIDSAVQETETTEKEKTA